MAVDLALLQGQGYGSPPTLRLYRWQTTAISLGAGQKIPPALQKQWQAAGLTIIRRPTGGRAVLHGSDLTYSVTANTSAGFTGRVRAVYRRLNLALQQSLACLGVQTELADGQQTRSGCLSADCFAAIAPGDLLWQGPKLCGSAQRWQEKAFLQHGSLLLSPPAPALLQLLHPGGPPPLAPISLEEILGLIPPWPALVQAFTEGFQQFFGLPVLQSDFTPAEKKLLENSPSPLLML